jgi:hypothetical protein
MIFDSKNSYKLELGRNLFDSLISKQAVIEVKEKRLKRSLDANGLYWLWLTCIQTETQLDKYEVHLLYRCTFLRRDEEYILKIIKAPVWVRIKKLVDDFKYFDGLNVVADVVSYSTTALETDKFSWYLKEIQKYARVNHNVILLNLQDKNFAEFYREYGFRS